MQSDSNYLCRSHSHVLFISEAENSFSENIMSKVMFLNLLKLKSNFLVNVYPWFIVLWEKNSNSDPDVLFLYSLFTTVFDLTQSHRQFLKISPKTLIEFNSIIHLLSKLLIFFRERCSTDPHWITSRSFIKDSVLYQTQAWESWQNIRKLYEMS